MPITVPHQAGEVRLGPLRPIAALMREMGHDPAVMLAECGLEASALDDAGRSVAYPVAARLIQCSARTTGRKDFGLLIGQRFEVTDLGLLGQLVWRSRTVGEALNDLQRFLHLQDRGSVAYVTRLDDDVVAVGYSIVDPRAEGVGLAYDTVMSIVMKLLRTVCGPQFKAVEVCLPHAEPQDVAPYRRCFAAPVVFDAPHAEVRFSAGWLDAPVAGADAALHAAVQYAAREVEAENVRSLAERVRGVVQVLVVVGNVSSQHVAGALGLHERTLRRRLAEEGVGLQQTVAAARFDVARQLLRETELNLHDIANALGYAEASAFVRAFRGWAGCTPGRWRERVAAEARRSAAAATSE